jgi:hypothetical protein
MSRVLVRSLFVALTLAFLAASAVLALPRERVVSLPKAASSGTSVAQRAWQFIQSFWAAEGSSLDPDGKIHQMSPPAVPLPLQGMSSEFPMLS